LPTPTTLRPRSPPDHRRFGTYTTEEKTMTDTTSDPLAGFTTAIQIRPGYDHRDDLRGTRGAHGTSLWLSLTGNAGAVVAEISLGWMERPLEGPFVPGGPQRRRSKPGVDYTLGDSYPSGAQVVAHMRRREGKATLESSTCEWLGGKPCYFGGAGFNIADDVLTALIRGGDREAFEFMAGLYAAWLGEKAGA
jgi:hypothetical protein